MLFFMGLDKEKKYRQLKVIVGLNFDGLQNTELYIDSISFDYFGPRKIIFFMVLHRVNKYYVVRIFIEQIKSKFKLCLVTSILENIIFNWEKYGKIFY